jgi:heptosyltransferase III
MSITRLPERPCILVITLRRLGDVLLTTPLIRAIRRGFPQATLDVLVFRGSAPILEGNPDIDNVRTMPERPSAGETLALVRDLWRRYDLALSTQAGDRPTFFAWVAARRRIGVVPPPGATGAWWKRHIHDAPVTPAPDSHRVTQLLQLATALGLEPAAEIVYPQRASVAEFAPRQPYAVVHASPFYRYKRWTDAGWRALARGLLERGLAVVASEGPDPAERAYMDGLWGAADVPVARTHGRPDWASLAALLAGARVYVGPDTSVTHLAAATGCPTVAIYGPVNPRLMGPWPVGGLSEPWNPAGTIQHRGNVWVVQNPLPCLPCEKLGCAGHLDSHSQCLDELSARQVLAAVDLALRSRPTASGRQRADGAAGQPTATDG